MYTHFCISNIIQDQDNITEMRTNATGIFCKMSYKNNRRAFTYTIYNISRTTAFNSMNANIRPYRMCSTMQGNKIVQVHTAKELSDQTRKLRNHIVISKPNITHVNILSTSICQRFHPLLGVYWSQRDVMQALAFLDEWTIQHKHYFSI